MEIITAVDRCLARMMGQDNTLLHGFARCVLVIVLFGSVVIASLWTYQWATTERAWEPVRPAAVAVVEVQPTIQIRYDAMKDASGVIGDTVVGLIAIAVVFGAYFFPTLIAGFGRKKQVTAIFVLNLLLGWTGLGWIASMVWACVED